MNSNRRLLFFVVVVVLFSLGVLFWFFFFAAPKTATTLGETVNPLSLRDFPKRFQFLNKDIGNDENITNQTTEVTKIVPKALTNIWKDPATGQTFITEEFLDEVTSTTTVGTTTTVSKHFEHATGTILMFVDRTTGHIYGYSKRINKLYQISNTTIPGVYDAYIFDNGKRVVMRYADTEKNVVVGVIALIPKVREDGQALPLLNTTNLPSQVTSVATNKTKTQLAYLVSNDTGASFYSVSSQKKPELIASSPFKEWSLAYGGDTLYATSKPSAYVEGQTVSLPTFSFIIGGKTGLMTNPSDGGRFLSSMWSSNGLKTFFTNQGKPSILSLATLSSKCAWGKDIFVFCAVPKTLPQGEEGLPDDWFQGRVSFDDDLVIVDSRENTSFPLYSFVNSSDLSFDVVGLSLSVDDKLISFTRKQDGSLWLLDTALISGD